MAAELRRARPADANSIADVLFASRKTFLPYLPSPRTEDEVRRWIAESWFCEQEITVAVAPSGIVGFVAHKRSDDVSWITNLYLLPGFVGQGIGSSLLASALATTPRPVRLWCFQQNSGARRFYEHHGFKPIKFTDGLDNEERTPDVLYELA